MVFLFTKNVFLFITIKFVHGIVQKLKFERFGISGSLEGIQCAIEMSDQTRFVKFDKATGECMTVQEDWLTEKKVEQDENYFVQTMNEPIFYPTSDEFWEIPQTFGIDSSVFAYVNSRTFISGSILALRFVESINPAFYHLSIGFRYSWNRITLNTFKDGRWGVEVRLDYDVQRENTDFKVEIFMRDSYFEVFVDENNLYNLTYRYQMQPPLYFRCISTYKSECLQIQFHFPVETKG